jgi:hypothetical protein
MTSEHLTKLHISHALGHRAARVAVLIVESFQLSFDMLDEQPSAVIEALIDHIKDVTQREGPKHPRYELRLAALKHAETVLENAKGRERRLFQGITGLEER